MSVQSALNENSINSIPRVKAVISNADAFEANQMKQKALSEMMNSPVAIVDMNSEQLEKFQDELIEVFNYKGWLNS